MVLSLKKSLISSLLTLRPRLFVFLTPACPFLLLVTLLSPPPAASPPPVNASCSSSSLQRLLLPILFTSPSIVAPFVDTSWNISTSRHRLFFQSPPHAASPPPIDASCCSSSSNQRILLLLLASIPHVAFSPHDGTLGCFSPWQYLLLLLLIQMLSSATSSLPVTASASFPPWCLPRSSLVPRYNYLFSYLVSYLLSYDTHVLSFNQCYLVC